MPVRALEVLESYHRLLRHLYHRHSSAKSRRHPLQVLTLPVQTSLWALSAPPTMLTAHTLILSVYHRQLGYRDLTSPVFLLRGLHHHGHSSLAPDLRRPHQSRILQMSNHVQSLGRQVTHLSLSEMIRYSHLDPRTGIANVRASARENARENVNVNESVRENANANNNVSERNGSKSDCETKNNQGASASNKGRINGLQPPPSRPLRARSPPLRRQTLV